MYITRKRDVSAIPRFELPISMNDSLHTQPMLQSVDDRYRLLAENSQDLVGLLDVQGNILYASPSHLQVLGYQAEELIHDNIFKLVHPEDAPSVRNAIG